jgi:predicted hydrocarbon binding protein
MIRAAPEAIRLRLVMRIVRRMVRRTYRGSRAVVRWRKGRGAVDIRGSIFCEVRERVEQPLCEFYASAIRRLMYLFNLDVDVGTERCRATGAGQCVMSIYLRQAGPPA